MNFDMEHASSKIFHLIIIKPTHYDDDGYPIRWFRSLIPSNSLASINGLGMDCRSRKVLGEEVDIRLHALDETSMHINPQRLIRMIERDRAQALIAIVGVQSNQFPRAVDIARPFRTRGLPVCIGGFHVSGCLAMLDEMPAGMAEAQELGISFFAGEAEEGRFEVVLKHAYRGELKPIYNYLDQLPDMPGQPVPFIDGKVVARTTGCVSSFDLGRGCPFRCTFCTIINVHGQKSRFRTADDLERIIRANHEHGINQFFITDDNIVRNRNWEELFDRLIWLRREERIELRLLIQVDMMCHRVPRFIQKAVEAGVDQVFVGMESINVDNLVAAGKPQNRIDEYREMLLAWKKFPVVLTAGYIFGFPNDRKSTFLQEVETIKRELPIDLIYFTYLTPLPGSEDHKAQVEQGRWMEEDINRYDLNHRVTHHSQMSDTEWEKGYREAWKRFYSFEHMTTVMQRMYALGSNKKRTTVNRLCLYGYFPAYRGIHPLEGGLLRLRGRKERRPIFPREHPLIFYPKNTYKQFVEVLGFFLFWLRLRVVRRRIERDPKRREYSDQAIAAGHSMMP
ncbi:MAG: radical SAM protein [Chlorobiales bacterium]|nr:radical SAM protein [Chlorobiales bacterium]